MDDDLSAEDLLAAAKRRTSAMEMETAAKAAAAAVAATTTPKKDNNSPQSKKASPSPVKEEKKDDAPESLTVPATAGENLQVESDGEESIDLNKKNNKPDEGKEGENGNNDNGIAPDESNAESEEEEDDDDSEDKEDDDDKSEVSASDLLAAVKGRMEQQKFMDEVKELRHQLDAKDEEIKTLKGQVQMAISTKQSLLIANQELEQQHLNDMEMSVRFEEDLRMSNTIHMDIRAEIEKDFMNDLASMAQKLHDAQVLVSEKEDQICKLEAQLTRKRLTDDQHCPDCVEKAEIIACLQEKVHKLEKLAPKQENDKVRFYKAKLGLK